MNEFTVLPVGAPDPLSLAWRELNDLGNAERLIERAQGKLLHVEGRGWIAFDGQRWSAEQGQVIANRLAHTVSRAMKAELAALKDAISERKLPPRVTEEMAKDRLVSLFKWAMTSGNANKTAAMLTQASNLVPATRDEFDLDPLAFNCRSGTLRFGKDKDGKWLVRQRPHDPGDKISKMAEVDYDPAATCPEWDAHLATVLPDPEVRRFFQAAVGYSMTGLTSEQCIFLLQGRGGDGKSTTMNVIRQMLGGYAASADVQTFMAGAMRSGADASPDLARLAGDMRLCSTGEPRRGAALDEAKIKAITGGSPIAARELHGDLFEYLPKFALWLECNAKPKISGDDDGIWRRIVVILFPHQFKGTDVDKRVGERLLGEASGILNWAIGGLLAWLEAGQLVAPQAVLDAVEDYRRAANPFGEWLAERVDTSDAGAATHAKALFEDYKRWCEEAQVTDREMMNTTAFGRALGDRQILRRKDAKGLILRTGAKLRPIDGSAPLAEPSATVGALGGQVAPYSEDDVP